MQYRFPIKSFSLLVAGFAALLVWLVPQPAYAYDNPELLPEAPTPVIDLAQLLNATQEEALVENIDLFEEQTGWKLRVLTQYDRSPGRAVKDFWNLDNKSILLIADQRGGNLLNFNVGYDLFELLPRTFWIELQTRYGNQFFVRENGEDQSILQALSSVQGCLVKGGCNVVPGLPREQWLLTLVTSLLGGVVLGFAAQPRKPGQMVSWQWALIFSPLWGILFVAFGIGPVVSRTSEWLPLLRNVLGFSLGALVAYLSPMMNGSTISRSET
ncbi:MAG: TPM domain-containing protein [Coleofasciculaceae cyanobacterium SM2_3_26]|nr:TPM domain-containing protein [Coleofasciculaceae cyanobacterium SM2_3_26]